MNKNQLIRCTLVSLVLALAACEPKVDTGGFVREEDALAKVKIGKSTKDEVREALGSPSSQSSFGEETWYYVSDKKESYAFLRPDLVQQDVMTIAFNSKGTVSEIKNYNLKDGEEVDLAKRTTPTEGHTIGFFEQVLGNIGRFNRPASGGTGIAPGRRPN